MKDVPYRIMRGLEIVKVLGETPGDFSRGEWEMIKNPKEILKLEQKFKNKLASSDDPAIRKNGWHSGIVAESLFYVHFRMFFRRPNPHVSSGEEIVLYDQILPRGRIFGNIGIAVLIINEKNKIILNRTFRPTVSNWMLEIPGTVGIRGEKPKDSVRRCVQVETGLEISKIMLLTDSFIVERGTMGGLIPLYLVKARGIPGKNTDPAVPENIALGKRELERAFKKGTYKTRSGFLCFVNDGYLLSALYLAEMKGLV